MIVFYCRPTTYTPASLEIDTITCGVFLRVVFPFCDSSDCAQTSAASTSNCLSLSLPLSLRHDVAPHTIQRRNVMFTVSHSLDDHCQRSRHRPTVAAAAVAVAAAINTCHLDTRCPRLAADVSPIELRHRPAAETAARRPHTIASS